MIFVPSLRHRPVYGVIYQTNTILDMQTMQSRLGKIYGAISLAILRTTYIVHPNVHIPLCAVSRNNDTRSHFGISVYLFIFHAVLLLSIIFRHKYCTVGIFKRTVHLSLCNSCATLITSSRCPGNAIFLNPTSGV